ncbi:MAG: UDP-N-acetylmuramate--L-alanine ligase [Halanaerobiaceae bacterium]
MKEHIHFVGIGGISMSGIAELLVSRGYRVSGSDLRESSHTSRLEKLGCEISIGHQEKNVRGADKLVISSAIPEDNVELQCARKKDIPVLARAEILAKLMEGSQGIAVSGTHGKTTTTSMISYVIVEAGLDPTVLLGGELASLGGNVRPGEGEYFITEADESDGSLLYFQPHIGVVTNLEMEHMDYYDTRQKLHDTFTRFLDRIPDNGRAILWAEDEALTSLIREKDDRFLTYGFNRGDIRAENIELLPFGSYYTLTYGGRELGRINLNVPGKYNILNSLAAVAVSLYVGLSFTRIKEYLNSFSGAGRRFEKKALIDGVLIVDDYAHHPTEIRETLKAAKNTGYERIIAVFQPHRYTRTKHFFREFSYSFSDADYLILTSIYSADEKKIPEVRAEDMVPLLEKNSEVEVEYIADFPAVVDHLEKIVSPRDMVITIGAGNIYKVAEELVNRLRG